MISLAFRFIPREETLFPVGAAVFGADEEETVHVGDLISAAFLMMVAMSISSCGKFWKKKIVMERLNKKSSNYLINKYFYEKSKLTAYVLKELYTTQGARIFKGWLHKLALL